MKVAIDGPSGAGKSTIAKVLAKKLGFIYVDTGAMYRAIGLFSYRSGIDGNDKEGIVQTLSQIKINIVYVDGNQRVILNGEDVSEEIRTPMVSKYASYVSSIPRVREFLLDLQRDMAESNDVIMDGRDIGTVILPDADVKIFLTASAEKRAERRYKELLDKGQHVTLVEVLEDMKQRDKVDEERATAPLKKADDAILVDTSDCDLEESVQILESIIKQ